MQAIQTQLTEEQAEKVSQMFKMLLMHPEMIADATADPHAALIAAGLTENDIVQVVDYLEDTAQNLRMELLPWVS